MSTYVCRRRREKSCSQKIATNKDFNLRWTTSDEAGTVCPSVLIECFVCLPAHSFRPSMHPSLAAGNVPNTFRAVISRRLSPHRSSRKKFVDDDKCNNSGHDEIFSSSTVTVTIQSPRTHNEMTVNSKFGN